MAKLNAHNLDLAPSANSWADVTGEIAFAAQIFAEYDAYDADQDYVSKLNCFAIGAKLFGVGQSLRFSAQNYLDHGFQEVDANPIAQPSVCSIHSVSTEGHENAEHVYVPIGETRWAIHKAGAYPLTIETIADIRARYIHDEVSQAFGFAQKYVQRLFVAPSDNPFRPPQPNELEWVRQIKTARQEEDTFVASLIKELEPTTAKTPQTLFRRLTIQSASLQFSTRNQGIVRRTFKIDLENPSDPIIQIQLRTPAEAREFVRLIYAAFIVNAYAHKRTGLNAKAGLIDLESTEGPWTDAFGLSEARVQLVGGRTFLVLRATPRLKNRRGYAALPPYIEQLLEGMHHYLSLDW